MREREVERRIADRLMRTVCDKPIICVEHEAHAKALAPEVRRLIEAAHQMGVQAGGEFEAERCQRSGDWYDHRPISWDALLLPHRTAPHGEEK